MKVRVTVTVEIDPDAWMQTYGVERDEVRRDVREYVEGSVHELAGIRECAPEEVGS